MGMDSHTKRKKEWEGRKKLYNYYEDVKIHVRYKTEFVNNKKKRGGGGD